MIWNLSEYFKFHFLLEMITSLSNISKNIMPPLTKEKFAMSRVMTGVGKVGNHL